MKRVLLLSLGLLLLCFPLISCDSEEGLASEDITEIVEGVGTSEMDTCTFDMDISGKIDVDAFGESMVMNIGGGGVGCMDNVNQEMCMPLNLSVTANIPGFGNQSEVMSMKTYIVDGWMYMYTDSEWTKMEVPQEMLGEQDQSILIGELTGLLALAEIDHKGSETVSDSNGNDVDCYVFQIKPDLAELAEDAFQLPGMDDFDLDGLEEIISSFDVECTFYIAKDNNLLMKIDLDLGGDLSSEDIQGMGDMDFGSSMNMSMDLSLVIEFDYDKPVTIELPAGASGAYDIGAYDTGW